MEEEVCVSYTILYFVIIRMSNISQLILGETGCVSYIIHSTEKKEIAIIDSFDGFEERICQGPCLFILKTLRANFPDSLMMS